MMGPFVKSNNSTKKMMTNLLIALVPIILFAFYKQGYVPYSKGYLTTLGLFYPLLFILTGTLTSFVTEKLYSIIFKRVSNYGIFPGLFLSLMLPINTPLLVLILGAFIATVIGKLVFGGFGKNIFNPALIGYIFITFAFASSLTYLNPYELDTISSSTPLTNASIVSGIGSYDELVKPYGSLFDFFIGNIPGSIGEVSSLLCLVAFAYLVITKTIKWRIPVIYVSTVFIITFIVSRLLGVGIYYPLFNILSGGLLFGSIFMATDPVTSPVTKGGQIIYAIFLGILTVLLRFTGVEGVATSILIMNMFVHLLDELGAKARFNLSKVLIISIVILVTIFGLGFYIASQKRVVGNIDPNFNIVSKEKINNATNYVVTQKGYGGNIKASVKVENDKIVSVEILSHHETKDKYNLVMDSDYINKLIQDIDTDTVSGATVTSSAIKKMLVNVMEECK